MSSMARRAKASRAYCALLAIDIELVDHREAAGQARGDEDKQRRIKTLLKNKEFIEFYQIARAAKPPSQLSASANSFCP